jgi:hypothetical protein
MRYVTKVGIIRNNTPKSPMRVRIRRRIYNLSKILHREISSKRFSNEKPGSSWHIFYMFLIQEGG